MVAQRELDSSPALFVQDWRAWLPPDDSNGERNALPPEEEARILRSDTPAAASVPAMLRRRLTPLGRAICEMLDALRVADDALPIIHASQHGDGQRPLDMLDAIAAGEALSPTRFSLSVHNATLGVYSIASGHRASMAALAASGAEFDALVDEALGYFAEGCNEVAVVLSDSPLPARYRAQAISSPTPSAIVLRLSQRCGRAISVQSIVERSTASAPRLTPAQLVNWLTTTGTLYSRRPARQWQLA